MLIVTNSDEYKAVEPTLGTCSAGQEIVKLSK